MIKKIKEFFSNCDETKEPIYAVYTRQVGWTSNDELTLIEVERKRYRVVPIGLLGTEFPLMEKLWSVRNHPYSTTNFISEMVASDPNGILDSLIFFGTDKDSLKKFLIREKLKS